LWSTDDTEGSGVLGTLESALPVSPEQPSSRVEVTTMNALFGLLLQWNPHGPHHPTGPHGPMGPGGWSAGGTMPQGAGGVGLGLFWALVALALVAVIVAGAYLALRAFDGDRQAEDGDRGTDALAILRRRYASGEVDDEEFERRRTRLGGGSSS
jgi:putative membrane protein